MRAMFAAGLMAAGLAGCAGDPINTPSGQPETTVSDVDVACMRGQILNHVVNQGHQIVTSTDTLIVGQRRAPSFGAQMFFGTMYAAAVERLQITMIATQPRTMRVIVNGAMVSNAGTAFERSAPMAGRGADQTAIGQGLQTLAAACQPPGSRPPAPEPVKISVQ